MRAYWSAGSRGSFWSKALSPVSEAPASQFLAAVRRRGDTLAC